MDGDEGLRAGPRVGCAGLGKLAGVRSWTSLLHAWSASGRSQYIYVHIYVHVGVTSAKLHTDVSTYPADAQEQRNERPRQEDEPRPVDLPQFVQVVAVLCGFQLGEEGEDEEGGDAEGEVEPEDPAPLGLLGERLADGGAGEGAEGPAEYKCQSVNGGGVGEGNLHDAEDGGPSPLVDGGDEIRDDHISEDEDAACAYALESAARERGAHIAGDTGNQGSDVEERETRQQHSFPAEDLSEDGEQRDERRGCE